MMVPVHKHDCDRCKYLATVHGPNGPVDWYECGESMVGRYDSEPSHNTTPHWSEPRAVYWDGKVTALADSSLMAWAIKQLFSANGGQ